MTERILFITATRIGDAVLSTGVLGALHDRFPEARFTIAAGPAAAPLFAEMPRLDRLIVLRKGPLARHWWRLWLQTVTTPWSLIVDFRRSAMRYLLFSRRRLVIGPDRPGVHKLVQAAAMLGLEDAPPRPRLWLGQQHMRDAARLIPSGAPVLALGPTANWPGKQWPAERFVALTEMLTGPGGMMPGARVAVFAGPDERATAEQVIARIPADRLIDLAGTVDLLTAYACLSRCRLYVGNDSGLMHLAAASGVPTLGLFGPSKDEHYAPWGPHCAVARTPESFDEILAQPGYDRFSGKSYIATLSIDAVADAAVALLGRTHEKRAAAGVA